MDLQPGIDRIFENFELADLQTMLSTARTQLIDGKLRTVTSATAGDVSVTKTWDIDLVKFLREVNWALSVKSAGYARPTRRTMIRYVG